MVGFLSFRLVNPVPGYTYDMEKEGRRGWGGRRMECEGKAGKPLAGRGEKTKYLARTVRKFSTENNKAITFGEGGTSIPSILRLN